MKAQATNNNGFMARLIENDETRQILFLIEAVGSLFDNNFDKGWFLNLLEKMSFSSSVLREIRQMLQLETLYERDIYTLDSGVTGLEEFIVFARRYLQPVLRDELGVSGFSQVCPETIDQSSTVVKGFFIYAFPYNLDRLEGLLRQLKPLVDNLQTEGRQLSYNVYASRRV
ncbi:MAG TPA: hypothetical protein VJ967_09600 [Clostridia bacterium]|nr:hypothetical protein [Clostridia bacterium]